MKKTKVLSTVLSLMLGITSVVSFTAAAETKVDNPQGTAIGSVYLEFNSGEIVDLKGDDISKNGKYDITWNVSDIEGFHEAVSVKLFFKYIEPFDFGENGKVELNVDEIWLDGKEYENQMSGKAIYGHGTDGFHNGNVLNMVYFIKNSTNKTFKADETVRVVFTLSGLSEPVTESGDIYGDVNDDNLINAVDASLVLAHYANTSTSKEGIFDADKSLAADINKDNMINAVDASAILAYYANISVTNDNVTVNDINTTWEEVEPSKLTKQVSETYKPFELENVINETDLVFKGTVIGSNEYDVQWIDENGENWGPYRNSIIEVEVNDVYYGQTDKDKIKIYYPKSISTLYTGAFLIRDGQEYIFIANVFDEDFYAKKANNPDDRFEQDKYSDVYITNSRDAVMPVINGTVSVFNGYFSNDEAALAKAISKEEVINDIPTEANKANWFLYFGKDDLAELLEELFNV